MDHKELNTEQFLSNDPVLLPEGMPEPVVMLNGKWCLNFHAPQAKSVSFTYADQEIDCVRNDAGVWQAELPFKSGVNYILLKIDGAEILTPYLPIGYGYSRPCNYIELPDADELFYTRQDVPQGRVSIEYFRSSVTNEWERCLVYTPYGYDSSDTQYPVLFLQHGHGENEIGWCTTGKLPVILDNLIAEKKCKPFAVVMNCGMVQVRRDGRRLVDFRAFDELLLNDVIPFVESRYRVGGSREMRALAGLSMGSLQTSISGFTHPELFSSLGIFSGFLHDWIQASELDMVDRAPSDDSHLKFLEELQDKDVFQVFFRAIGDEDPFLEYFEKDNEIVEKSGISEVRKIYKGTHDWNTWRKCIRDFAQLIFR